MKALHEINSACSGLSSPPLQQVRLPACHLTLPLAVEDRRLFNITDLLLEASHAVTSHIMYSPIQFSLHSALYSVRPGRNKHAQLLG